MKFIRLLGNFYRRNIFGSAILFCVVTFALFLMTYVMGIIRYITFSRDVFVHSGLNGGYYFMSTANIGADNYADDIDRILETTKQIDGVDKVLTATEGAVINEEQYIASFLAINQDFAESYRPILSSGNWLTDNINIPAGTIPAVASGPTLNNVQVGDIIEFSTPKTGQNGSTTSVLSDPVRFFIVGTLGEFSYIPNYGSSGATMTTGAFLRTARHLIILDTLETQETLIKNNAGKYIPPNYFILLESGLAPEQKEACLNELKSYGQLASSEEILANTSEKIKQEMIRFLPYPLFAMVISTFCFFSLSILFVQKKLEEASVYALCGCSKKKNFAIAAVGLGLIGTLACLTASIAMAKYYEDYKSLALVNMQDYNIYVDYKSYLYLFAYLVLMLAISLAVPFLARRKMSPIELYRRKTQ